MRGNNLGDRQVKAVTMVKLGKRSEVFPGHLKRLRDDVLVDEERSYYQDTSSEQREGERTRSQRRPLGDVLV